MDKVFIVHSGFSDLIPIDQRGPKTYMGIFFVAAEANAYALKLVEQNAAFNDASSVDYWTAVDIYTKDQL